jgi:nucleotide-binding universal stress UspA family protein
MPGIVFLKSTQMMEVTMKNVLLLVHDDEGQEARFQAALDLTRALDGHLRCVDVTIIPPPFPGELAYGGALLLEDERIREGKNKAALESRLAHEDVPWDWVDSTGGAAESVIDAAALADIVVLSNGLDPYPTSGDGISQILMGSRKPVLAVPKALERLSLDRALVAWDGRASAAETLQACTPLLACAKEVEIFMVRDGSERVEPEEAAEYLSRHGVHATVRTISEPLHVADAAIEEECARWRPDYLVMGAYSRGRLLEIFGGVTTRLLQNANVPIVLGH